MITFKAGRKRPLAKHPCIKLKDFLLASAPAAPPEIIDWVKSGNTPIYASTEDVLGNATYGDCTCAGAGHILDILRANVTSPWRPSTTADALAFYSRVTMPPFNPLIPLTDTGADENTVLSVWQQQGFFADGTGKIAAWASVDPTNVEECKQAIYLFGNLYLGIELPDAWVNPTPSGSGFVWDVAGDPDPNNGHCIIAYGANDQGVFVDSWGMYGTVTWAALAKYFTQEANGDCFTILGPDWENQVTQKSPNGLDYAQLQSYIKTLFN